MSIHDAIGDMLTVIRNGVRAGKAEVNVRRSKLVIAILNILKRENYIFDYKTIEDATQGAVRVYIKPPQRTAREVAVRKIARLERISRPGLRIYATTREIPNVLNGLGMCIVSTSKGVFTGREARKRKIGGEVLLKVW